MPQELQIIRASEFIRMGARGEFDLAASKAALADLMAACRKRGIENAMMDLRALHPGPKPVFTPADLTELVHTFPEAGFTPHQRLAILYKADPHRRARLFAFLSTMHGWKVQAFGDFEEALFWLSDGHQDLKVKAALSNGKRIPVRFAKTAEQPGYRSIHGAREKQRPGALLIPSGRHRKTINQSTANYHEN